jgi:hypothetical protein
VLLLRREKITNSVSFERQMHDLLYYNQCPDEIVPAKSTSTTLRNPSLSHKHDSVGSLLLKTNQLNRVYM